MIHDELLKALEKDDYESICKYLHTKIYASDSTWTIERCNESFIQGWMECERISEILREGSNWEG